MTNSNFSSSNISGGNLKKLPLKICRNFRQINDTGFGVYKTKIPKGGVGN